MFWKYKGKGSDSEIEWISALNTFSDFIHNFELVKLTYKTKEEEIKSVESDLLLDYSCSFFRIRAMFDKNMHGYGNYN